MLIGSLNCYYSSDFRMSFFTSLFSSLFLGPISEFAAIEDAPQVSTTVLADLAAIEDIPQVSTTVRVSRGVAAAFPFLSREIQVKTILHHSGNLNTIRRKIKHTTFDEFLNDLVLFNVPELDEAFRVELDSLVESVEHVVESYIACLDLPYCKYLPRGLRNPQGAEVAGESFKEFMLPNGNLNEAIYRRMNDDSSNGLNYDSSAGFIDDFYSFRKYGHFQVLARADKSVIMVSKESMAIQPFTLIPSARMLIRVVGRKRVELWHSDSFEPQILEVLRRPDSCLGLSCDIISLRTEISPDHKRIMIRIQPNITANNHRTIYVAQVLHNSSPFENSNLWHLFKILYRKSIESRERGSKGTRVDDSIFRPEVRDAELLAAFRGNADRIQIRRGTLELRHQEERLRRINEAITEPDAVLLPLIKEFLSGIEYFPSATYRSAKWLRHLIDTTKYNYFDPMYQLSAQQLWDTSVTSEYIFSSVDETI